MIRTDCAVPCLVLEGFIFRPGYRVPGLFLGIHLNKPASPFDIAELCTCSGGAL